MLKMIMLTLCDDKVNIRTTLYLKLYSIESAVILFKEHMDDDSAPLPIIQSCNEELESKAMIKLCKEEPESTRVIKILKDTLESNGNKDEEEEEKLHKEDEASANKKEEKLVKDFFGVEEDTKEKIEMEDKKFSEVSLRTRMWKVSIILVKLVYSSLPKFLN